MKSPPKMPQMAMVRIWVASLHQELRYPMGTGVSVLSATQKGTQGWIRTASTRRTVRRGKKPLRGFFRCAARAIHPSPPRTPVSNGYRSFCFISLEKGDTRVDSNSCGAVAEDSAKTAQWAVFSSAARDVHPRPPRTPVSEPGTGVSVLSALKKGTQGWIRTATATTAASRMRVPPKARCSRWEQRPWLLIQRGS